MTPLRWVAFTVLTLASAGLAPAAAQSPDPIAVLDVKGPIGPATADYVERTIDKALAQNSDLIVLRMDTPGGLVDSMRSIIQKILASPVPVVGFVAPGGAHAASAGTFILYACHVAAMAPGTNLGAATPIQIGGGGLAPPREAPKPAPADAPSGATDDESGEVDDAPAPDQPASERAAAPAGLEDKILNDAVAYIRSLAQLRGRNVDWAERAVREAASLPAAEALDQGVIDLIADDLDDLLVAIDGRQVEIGGAQITLDTAGRDPITYAPDWRTQLLGVITNPNVAYILMLIGIYGIIFEFYSPGLVFPGVAGAVSLLLALYAFQVLPVNLAGLALIVLGLVLMISELFVPSFGALGIGGVVGFVVGSIMLMDTDAPGFGVAWEVVGGISLTAALLLLLTVTLLGRSYRRPVVSGREEMIGSTAKVIDWDGATGRVRVQGEIWRARGRGSFGVGQAVTVRAVDGLTVEVGPASAEPSKETR